MLGIRLNCNKSIGIGHFYRCCSIAEELCKKGAAVIFLCSNDSDISVFEDTSFDAYIVQNSSSENIDIDDEINTINKYKITTLLIDCYNINQEYLSAMRKATQTVLLDDLNMFDYDVDAIINYNIEASAEMYSRTQVKGRRAYIGLSFFPLRNNLALYRKDRELRDNVGEVLILTGSTDPCGCAETILNSLKPSEYKEIIFKVLIGKFYTKEYCLALKKQYQNVNNVVLLPWGQDMGALYKNADLVISPGSTTAYEALSLGTPCITYQFVENHHDECIALDEMGIASFAGICNGLNDKSFSFNMYKLFCEILNGKKRTNQYRVFSPLLDGGGSERIAHLLVEGDTNYEVQI